MPRVHGNAPGVESIALPYIALDVFNCPTFFGAGVQILVLGESVDYLGLCSARPTFYYWADEHLINSILAVGLPRSRHWVGVTFLRTSFREKKR